MNKKSILFSATILFAGWMIVGCEGPAGPAGQQGPQGESGPPGEQGNANLFYSDWMDIEWYEDSSDVLKEMAIHDSRIDSDFLINGGIVLMYMKVEGTGGVFVYLLPVVFGVDGNFQFRFILADAPGAQDGDGLQGMIFILQSMDGTTSIPNHLWENFRIRYLLIPGNNSTQNKMAPGFFENYNAVKNYYQIPD